MQQILEGYQQLTWLVGGIIDRNEDAELEVRSDKGNVIFFDRDGGGLRLPLELLAADNHAPDITYTYLIIPEAALAVEFERLRNNVIPVEARWNKENSPAGIFDITKLEGEDAEYSALADEMVHYITVKANTEGIYDDELLQQKYAAAMAVVLAVLHKANANHGLLDPVAEAKLEVMRAGGSLGILTRAVTGADVLPALAAKAEEDIPVEHPGAKRIVTNPDGKEGDSSHNQIMLGLIDEVSALETIPAGAVIRFQEVVVASNATLMGFVVAMEYLERLPSVIEVVAPFVTQAGIADFIRFCAARNIEVRVVTASIDPALNHNWYVVIPPDADDAGEPTNADYLRTSAALGDTAPQELYYMGDGGDILAFLLKLLHAPAAEVREYMYPLIANLAVELGGTERDLILKLIPDVVSYIEG